MPLAAIATGRVDFVLTVEQIPSKLVDLWQNSEQMELPDAQAIGIDVAESDSDHAEVAIRETLAILKKRTGNDFQHYKRGTVLRRLERRMQVTRQPKLGSYRDYLVGHPQEVDLLLQDMLISVTSFFRDPDAFKALERALVENLETGRVPPQQLRAWVAGCATGEEAYSVAMILNGLFEHGKARPAIQVFASDIDDRALSFARAGIYVDAAAASMTPERIKHYFVRDDRGLRIAKPLRQQVLFARHNVLKDPPFSKVDLITCRNLLIYLDRDVQRKVLELFHFALNPGGLLFLGTAESADALEKGFFPIDRKQRIYRAVSIGASRDADLASALSSRPDRAGHAITITPPLAQLHQRLLDENVRASVIADTQYNILHTSAGASRYLRYVDGQPSQNLLNVLLPQLAAALRPALLLAATSGKRVSARPVKIEGEQAAIELQMTVRATSEGSGQLLVFFEEIEVRLEPSSQDTDAPHDIALLTLESEIRRLQEQLSRESGESGEADEAARASNEELQSINEELRSASEELETSKEELQSVNEELTTVNFELKTKIEEAAKVNDDLSNLIGSMNMATVFVDRTLRIRGFTPLAATVFNVMSTDIGRKLSDLTHRLDYGDLEADIARVLLTLQPAERELASSEGRWYLMRLTAYRTNGDRIDGAVLNFIDVTERRLAQEQVRIRDERLRLVADSTRDYAVITMDSEGHITGFNNGAELMFGYEESELLSRHFRILFVPQDRDSGQPEQELDDARTQGRAVDERWHLRKDGSRFFCSGITTPLREGSGEGYAKIARDLTERQLFDRKRDEVLRAEQEVRQRLEQASATRGEFLAVMSHELKNPLNLIVMNAELIGRSPVVANEPRLSRAVDIIRRTVQGQSQIIDDLLDLSRVTTGKLALSRVAVQWAPIVERITAAVRTEAEHRQISLDLDLSDVTIYADMVRVEQIVWNLVSNALKFTPPGGSVRVRLAREGDWGVLEVEDTGRGIAPGFIEHIFEMFQQAEGRSATRRDGGLGIGLALAKSLTDLHGGRVEARSEGLGKGAKFVVWLPCVEGQFARDPITANRSTGLVANRRLLIVDDDIDALEVLADLLTAEGAQVTSASDARSALRHLESGDFDLLISDIAMPGMSGLELIARARQQVRSATLPAFALSGFTRPEDIEKSRSAGFDAHLCKPLSMEALEFEIAKAMFPRN